MNYIIIICILCISLGSKNKITQKNDLIISPDSIRLDLEHAAIAININSFTKQDIIDTDSSEVLMIYDEINRSFLKYDTGSGQLIDSTRYHRDIEDVELQRILSFDYVTYDTIVVLHEDSIFFFNSSLVYHRISTDFEDSSNEMFNITNLDHSDIHYNGRSQRITAQTYCYTCKPYKSKFYKSPVLAYYSLESNSIKPLPIYYPEIYKRRYFGFHNLVFKSEDEQTIYVGYSASPLVQVYYKQNKSSSFYSTKCSFQSKPIAHIKRNQKFDSNLKLKHITLQPVYKEILYDKYRDLFYRFYLTGIEEKNEDGTYNAWPDKELVLLIFDNRFNLIKELNLGAGIYNSTKSFIAKSGLHLNKFESTRANHTEYDILQIL